MMRFIGIKIIISVIFFASLRSAAQKDKTVDTGTIIKLNREAWEIRNDEPDLSKKYALQAIIYGERAGYSRELSYSYNALGYYHKVKGHYNMAFYYYQKSLDMRLKLKDTIAISRTYRNLMQVYILQGRYRKATETGLLAIDLLAPKMHDLRVTEEKAQVQVSMAAAYLKTGEYDLAIKNALEAKSIYKASGSSAGLASVALNLGNIYEAQKYYEKALVVLKEALKINAEANDQKEMAKVYSSIGNIYYNMNRYSEALSNYNMGLSIRKQNGYDDEIGGSLLNMGLIYESFGKRDSAMYLYKQSLELNLASGNIEDLYEGYRSIGSLLNDKKRYTEAINYLQKASKLSLETDSRPEKMILLREISRAYQGLGNQDSALIYNEQYTLLSDSLNNAAVNSIRLAADIKEKENEVNLEKEKNRSQAYVITVLFLAIGLMAATIFIFIRNAIAKKRMLQLQDIIKEQELLAVDAMVEGQEIERKRLATELHDTIGSVLSAVKFSFKSMENSLAELLVENKNRYVKINDMLDEALGSVRRISHDMAAGALEKGIGDALQRLCETLQETGKINIRLGMYGFEDKAESVTELNLYRIIQELLTNILKHANAQNVSIQLIKSKDNINLVVEDDGDGFDPGENKNGIGLRNINTRVKKLSGKWNIDSGKGKGTTTVVDIPVNDNNI